MYIISNEVVRCCLQAVNLIRLQFIIRNILYITHKNIALLHC